DAVAQVNWFDVQADSDHGARLDTSGWALAASLEAGYPFRIGERWQLEPQAQIVYQTVSVDADRDAYSKIAWAEDDAVTGRVGARLQYRRKAGDKLWQPYLKVDLWHTFSGTDRT
ncbi:MAG: autotransporter outer membrane beta-barrel domain-containing protein, partial [Burkholderiales bacterium]|nr:autotransporter outer membrane beta-barrel domain-containing protein [Burkholderiales bacterium]